MALHRLAVDCFDNMSKRNASRKKNDLITCFPLTFPITNLYHIDYLKKTIRVFMKCQNM